MPKKNTNTNPKLDVSSPPLYPVLRTTPPTTASTGKHLPPLAQHPSPRRRLASPPPSRHLSKSYLPSCVVVAVDAGEDAPRTGAEEGGWVGVDWCVAVLDS